jgi:hypothetical protein
MEHLELEILSVNDMYTYIHTICFQYEYWTEGYMCLVNGATYSFQFFEALCLAIFMELKKKFKCSNCMPSVLSHDCQTLSI